MTNWSQISKKKRLDEDSFDHARVTTGHSLQKDLIQANAVVDSTEAETVDEAETEVVVAETVDEAETVAVAATEVVAETVAVAATEVVVDSDNVAKVAVAAPVDTDFDSD